jgi:hypothetical protein
VQEVAGHALTLAGLGLGGVERGFLLQRRVQPVSVLGDLAQPVTDALEVPLGAVADVLEVPGAQGGDAVVQLPAPGVQTLQGSLGRG